MASERPTVLKYYALRAVSTPGFMWPVSIYYLVSHDVSYATLALGGAAAALLTVVGEVPTGYVSDRLGRRNTIVVAQLLFGAYPLTLLYARSPPTVVAAFCLLGLAETLQSGSVSAWLYDALDAHDATDRFTHVAGRGSAIRLWVLAATMVAGGLMYAVDPDLPFVASTVMGTTGALVVTTFPATGDGDDGDVLGVGEAVTVVREHLLSRELRAFVLLWALTAAVGQSARSYVQPITVDSLSPVVAGATVAGHPLAETAVLGVVYASFTAFGAVLSDRAAGIESRLGTRGAVLGSLAFDGVAMLAVFAEPLLVVPMMFVHRGVVSVLVPVQRNYVNRHAESVGRATVLSAVSMVTSVAKMPVGLAAGVVADALGPTVAVGGLGVVVLSAAVVAGLAGPVVVGGDSGATPAD
ncbi:MFS transporter [Haloarchaeobius sp. HRN-SO-5]|uniref:MFS transporter n=1 Tax=Haloarchaeobius sp. HRN-SO-5 TaxID=3446118 RepID=UPI003EBFAB48